MNVSEILTVLVSVVGLILSASSVYAIVLFSKYKGRQEALTTGLQLMGISNTELRAENDRLRAGLADVTARVDVLQSDIVKTIVNEIAQAAALAVTTAIMDAWPYGKTIT